MTFALVTEGISEHRIIKHLISKYLKDADPDINQMQPRLTDNEKKQSDGSIGGWVEVLKYCENEEELESIFHENDYLVIQIDSDCCELNPFNVSRLGKSNAVLHKDIITRLLELIPDPIKTTYKDRIFFAICIHTIECWLLPIYYSDTTHKCKTDNCLSHLNKALDKKNIQTISTTGDKNNSNSKAAYLKILQNLNKKKDIKGHSAHNEGFKHFINQLDTITV